ncbi:MAG: threonylcarbamoyl-AMP synthase [Rickettsiales bacterium]|nr:threonylcarbamoyl-AMP synthase [Rickettsiales bacterium]
MKIISENDPQVISLAVDFLRAGKIISFATDTVYGVAVDASNYNAIERLYVIKKRNKNKPIAIFLPDLSMAEKIFIFSDEARKFAKKFLQISLTLVLKKRHDSLMILASNLNNGDEFLGFRIVEKKFIIELLKNFGGIMAVTSANVSGLEDSISADQVKKYFNFNEIDLLIDGGVCEKKNPSAVIKIDDKITILREGGGFNINSNIL